ncbi:MAG TPA: DUF423 domain-containing protein [Opitutaceae bacterium]|jgi:uncharacterized membrane protein YgdD (TMEM256/DUF423 family)|nr:DUF423 domain-containing protein [Opitutaceae bacterium]
MHARTPLLAAALLGAAGIVTGALGAHALDARLTAAGMRQAWETAVHFQLFHAAALVGLAGWLRPAPAGEAARRSLWVVRLWILGTILFSGSLYGLALGGPRLLGPVTPLGGLCLLGGWLCLAATALAPKSEYEL